MVRDLHRQRDQRSWASRKWQRQLQLSDDSLAGHGLQRARQLALRLRCALFQLRRHGRLRTPAGFRPDWRCDRAGLAEHLLGSHRAQYYATSGWRCGSAINTTPARSAATQAFFNVASPLIIENVVGTGLSYRLTEHEIVSMAYLHGFQNELTGPMYSPSFFNGAVAIPGTSVHQRRLRRRFGRWPDHTVLTAPRWSSGFSRPWCL